MINDVNEKQRLNSAVAIISQYSDNTQDMDVLAFVPFLVAVSPAAEGRDKVVVQNSLKRLTGLALPRSHEFQDQFLSMIDVGVEQIREKKMDIPTHVGAVQTVVFKNLGLQY